MVLLNPVDRVDATRAVACFLKQGWPVKQLVIVNATSTPVGNGCPGIKELFLKSPNLGDLKNAALLATDGEWCFPWDTECWYAPDYLSFLMASSDRASATAIQNPVLEGETQIEATVERASFFNFFRHRLDLPAYDKEGSDVSFLGKLGQVRPISQVGVLAKRFVSETEILKLRTTSSSLVTRKKGSVCLVQLGRLGDIAGVLPLALHIHNTYGKPYFMVSRPFVGILDGVSYVEPFVVDLPCNRINEGMAIAKCNFEYPIQTQIWGEDYDQEKLTESYNKEMWRMGGFLAQFENRSWRPVFDRAVLPKLKDLPVRLSGKPLILTNLTCGASSPFPEGADILKGLTERWRGSHQVLDVGLLRLPHVYDLIPLIEAADVLVSIDTVHLHLAVVTSTPVVALVNPHPWLGTICRGTTAARFDYDQVRKTPSLVQEGVATALMLGKEKLPPAVQPGEAPKRRVFHVIAKYDEPVATERKRKQFAKDSWDVLYAAGVIPAYYTDWKRTLAHINTKAKLPFFKDLLQPALAQAADDDILAYTNDDIICHPDLPAQLRFYCAVWGCVSGRRCEGNTALPLDATPEKWREIASNNDFDHYGRDLFAFTKRWIMSVWDELPDFVVGSTDWDNCVVAMMRRSCGYESVQGSFVKLIWPVEMPLGWTCHIWHKSVWSTFGNYWSSPGNTHNRELFRAWAEKHAPKLQFDKNNLLA